jgi:Mrp family chromosome partitioning ATPase
VRSGETPKEAFTRTRDLLVSVKCNILGVVLNAVNAKSPDYYYSYRYYPYSYGYGPQEAANSHHEDQDSERVAERVSHDRDDDFQAL